MFFNENAKISIKISFKFVPNGPINNIPALVQVMAWRRPGDKLWLVYQRIYASLDLNELNAWSSKTVLYFDPNATEICSLDSNSAVPVLTWHRSGDKLLPESMLKFYDTIWRH